MMRFFNFRALQLEIVESSPKSYRGCFYETSNAISEGDQSHIYINILQKRNHIPLPILEYK